MFRALSDPTRRSLLDALHEEDGQTLVALTAGHDDPHRGGQASAPPRGGRPRRHPPPGPKLHFLNPVPIRLIHDRWVSKYTEPWAAGLAGLKTELEHTMEKIFEIYIRTTPERLWEAITDPAIRAKYHFGVSARSDWTPGSSYTLEHPGVDGPLAVGENLVVDPPHRLVQTMFTLWSEEARSAGTTRVTWEIEPVGDSCRLTVTHDQLTDDAPPELYGGWPMILSGLKTWLETGETLTTPGSLMYGEPDTAPPHGGTTMTTMTDVRTVGVTVRDQDAALDFYVGTLGFEKRLDAPISPTQRWVEVAPRRATTSIALTAGQPDGPTDTGIRFTVADAESERTDLAARGVTVGDLLRWGEVPPMFEFDDPDGNHFYVVEDAS